MISIQGFDIFWKWWADLLNHGPAWAQFYEQDILQAVDAAGKKIKDAKGFEDKANDLSKPQTYTKYINHILIIIFSMGEPDRYGPKNGIWFRG